MAQIEELLGQADTLMDQAEAQIDQDYNKAGQLFQEAIIYLEQTFLMAKGEASQEGRSLVSGNAAEDLTNLYAKCLQLETEFESIRDEVMLLAEFGSIDDPEQLCDITNEIWDFMYGLMEDLG